MNAPATIPVRTPQINRWSECDNSVEDWAMPLRGPGCRRIAGDVQ